MHLRLQAVNDQLLRDSLQSTRRGFPLANTISPPVLAATARARRQGPVYALRSPKPTPSPGSRLRTACLPMSRRWVSDRGATLAAAEMDSLVRTITAVKFLETDGAFIEHMSLSDTDLAMVEASNHDGHGMGIEPITRCRDSERICNAVPTSGVHHAQS